MVAVYAAGVIFFCGGILNAVTVNKCGTYTLATQTFGSMAPLPLGVNHAAFAWDGQDSIFIAGGR
jgi:hypothetical protein